MNKNILRTTSAASELQSASRNLTEVCLGIESGHFSVSFNGES